MLAGDRVGIVRSNAARLSVMPDRDDLEKIVQPLAGKYIRERRALFDAKLKQDRASPEVLARDAAEEIQTRTRRIAEIVADSARAESTAFSPEDLLYAFEWTVIGEYAFADPLTCLRQLPDISAEERARLIAIVAQSHDEETERAHAMLREESRRSSI
jgi:hypothetical protein